jgi:putative phosphoribosyl transferase
MTFLKTNSSIALETGGVLIEGLLQIPAHPLGIVLFAHGSGSSRFSPRNRFVATKLHQYGVATLLIDLLTIDEDQIYETRFDIQLLAERLFDAAQYLRKEASTQYLPLGLFGASTGSAAAIKVASQGAENMSEYVRAVVSRGGRPDMALAEELSHVLAPTLFIVGGDDQDVLLLNKRAYESLNCVKKLEIIARATHLFEEAGAMEKVAQLATQWFLKYLRQ